MKPVLLLAIVTVAAHAQCPVNTIILKGRVENPTPNSHLRVQLSYPKRNSGESADATVQDGSFRLPIEFLTQNTKPLLQNLHAKCDRKPSQVVITLFTGDSERGHLTLNFPRDFIQTDPTAYTARPELVLKETE